MRRLVPLAALLQSFAFSPAAQAEECKPGFASLLPSVVRKEAVAAIDETYAIRLWSFCRGLEFHDLGNAASLTRTIAANPLLVAALAERGARPDDVRFVRVLDATIDLWVHRN